MVSIEPKPSQTHPIRCAAPWRYFSRTFRKTRRTMIFAWDQTAIHSRVI